MSQSLRAASKRNVSSEEEVVCDDCCLQRSPEAHLLCGGTTSDVHVELHDYQALAKPCDCLVCKVIRLTWKLPKNRPS